MPIAGSPVEFSAYNQEAICYLNVNFLHPPKRGIDLEGVLLVMQRSGKAVTFAMMDVHKLNGVGAPKVKTISAAKILRLRQDAQAYCFEVTLLPEGWFICLTV